MYFRDSGIERQKESSLFDFATCEAPKELGPSIWGGQVSKIKFYREFGYREIEEKESRDKKSRLLKSQLDEDRPFGVDLDR